LRSSLVYEVRMFVEDPKDVLRLGMPATVYLPINAGQTGATSGDAAGGTAAGDTAEGGTAAGSTAGSGAAPSTDEADEGQAAPPENAPRAGAPPADALAGCSSNELSAGQAS